MAAEKKEDVCYTVTAFSSGAIAKQSGQQNIFLKCVGGPQDPRKGKEATCGHSLVR